MNIFTTTISNKQTNYCSKCHKRRNVPIFTVPLIGEGTDFGTCVDMDDRGGEDSFGVRGDSETPLSLTDSFFSGILWSWDDVVKETTFFDMEIDSLGSCVSMSKIARFSTW